MAKKDLAIKPLTVLYPSRCTPLHWQIDTVDYNKQVSIYWYSRKSLGYYYSTILAQAELSKATEIYSLTFSRPDGVVRTLLPPKSLGKILFPFMSSSSPWPHCSISASGHVASLSWVCVSSVQFLKGCLPLALGTTQVIQDDSTSRSLTAFHF